MYYYFVGRLEWILEIICFRRAPFLLNKVFIRNGCIYFQVNLFLFHCLYNFFMEKMYLPIWINRVTDPSYHLVFWDFSLAWCDRWVTEGTSFIGNALILHSLFLIFSPLHFAAALIDSQLVLEFVILCVFWGESCI